MSTEKAPTEEYDDIFRHDFEYARSEQEIEEMNRKAWDKRTSEFKEMWALEAREREGEKLPRRDKNRLERLQYVWRGRVLR